MELGMLHGMFTGKCHNYGKHGHKAAEYWISGKTPCSNRYTPYQVTTQKQKSSNHRIRRVIFCLCKVPLAIYKVYWLKSLNSVRVLVVSHCLTNNRLTRRKL